jgi:hypothetical protein
LKRTDASGHDSNNYTEGNPALNIPATVVGAEEMNNIQNELANAVEAAGLTLDGGDENQLLEALNILIAQGGGAPGTPDSPNISVSLTDNIGVATTVTGVEFNSGTEIAAYINYHIARRDDTKNAIETGVLIAYFDAENTTWNLSQEVYTPAGQVQAVGATFTINGLGQVQYVTSNYGGSGYTGAFKATIKKVQA